MIRPDLCAKGWTSPDTDCRGKENVSLENKHEGNLSFLPSANMFYAGDAHQQRLRLIILTAAQPTGEAKSPRLLAPSKSFAAGVCPWVEGGKGGDGSCTVQRNNLLASSGQNPTRRVSYRRQPMLSGQLCHFPTARGIPVMGGFPDFPSHGRARKDANVDAWRQDP